MFWAVSTSSPRSLPPPSSLQVRLHLGFTARVEYPHLASSPTNAQRATHGSRLFTLSQGTEAPEVLKKKAKNK